MSTNLINILAFAKTKYPDLQFVYDFPPTFLRTILNNNNKIIFAHKLSVDKKNEFESPITRIENVITKNNSNLDLTGSPLRDDCGLNDLSFSLDLEFKNLNPWIKNEENLKTIELERVRAIISDQIMQNEAKKTSSFGSLWFICKSTEQDNTIMMSLNFEESYNSVSLVKNNYLVSYDSLNCDNLMAMHYALLKTVKSTETHIENNYKIKPNLSLQLSWSTSDSRPQLINLKNCNTILLQEIYFEDNDSIIEHFWRQLSILSLINEDILNLKINDQIGNEINYKWGRGIDIDVLKEKIIEAMTELPGYIGSCESDSNEIEAVAQKAINRPLTEITDKLWEILKCCHSYKDLKLGFTHIFQCAAQRNIINMPNNENSLAKIIREVAQHRLAIPNLTGAEPLELLLEIGLEKLQKDYEYILIESKICGPTDLQRFQNTKENSKRCEQNLNGRNTILSSAKKVPNLNTSKYRKTLLHNLQNNQSNEDDEIESIGFQNSRYNEKEVESKLSKLYQVHTALEHLLSIQINLNLKNVYNQIFEQLLQRPLQAFPRNMDKRCDSVSIPILTEKILGHVENKNPQVRRIVISSSNKFKEVQSTYYYNIENIYPPNIFDQNTEVSEEKSTTNDYYFHSSYHVIKTKRI